MVKTIPPALYYLAFIDPTGLLLSTISALIIVCHIVELAEKVVSLAERIKALKK